MSILKDFYDGNVQPYDKINARDPDYDAVSKEIDSQVENWLRKKLTDEDFEKFDKLQDLYCDCAYKRERRGFAYGFKLGALMMIEVLTEKEFRDFAEASN